LFSFTSFQIPFVQKTKVLGFPRISIGQLAILIALHPFLVTSQGRIFPNLGKKVKQVWVYKQKPSLAANHFGNFLEASEC